MQLFYHFATSTCQTLLLTPEVWGHALQLSFQFEFLMNAILCVAARHLAILQPKDTMYPAAAASHLCSALSLFRQVLSKSFTSINLDAFIATSLLFQYEVWTNTDFVFSQDDGVISFDPSKDRIFSLSSGMKQVFLKTVPLALDQSSVFMPQIAHNPRNILVKAAKVGNDTLVDYQDHFSYHRPLHLNLLNIPLPNTRDSDLANLDTWNGYLPKMQEPLDIIKDGYTAIVTELCLIISFLPDTLPSENAGAESPLLPALARYIFSFPVVCRGPFTSMVQQSDPHALLVLYHFYRAARILLPPDECWWAYKRAILSEIVLKEWLTREIINQVEALY
jgi:hypothetical protein